MSFKHKIFKNDAGYIYANPYWKGFYGVSNLQTLMDLIEDKESRRSYDTIFPGKDEFIYGHDRKITRNALMKRFPEEFI